jgi:hypothetical protein
MKRHVLMLGVLAVAACGGNPVGPAPPPDRSSEVTPGDSTGPVRITFVAGNIAPGTVVDGCGTLIEGCAGRLRVTLKLEPPAEGVALYARIYLHATNLVACLSGETGSFVLRAGVPQMIEIVLDRADRCGTPTTMATMAAIVEGPAQIASRQTWAVRYVFAP